MRNGKCFHYYSQFGSDDSQKHDLNEHVLKHLDIHSIHLGTKHMIRVRWIDCKTRMLWHGKSQFIRRRDKYYVGLFPNMYPGI